MSQFTRSNNLDLFCSGGVGNQTGEAIAIFFHNIVARVQRLERVSFSSPSFSPSSLGSTHLPPSSTIIDSKLASVSAELSLVKSSVVDLTSRIEQDTIGIGGVKFQSLSQTIAWVCSDLLSTDYFVFKDIMTLLDLIGISDLSDSDFIDG